MSFEFTYQGTTYQVQTHPGNGWTRVEVREKDEARECDLEPAQEES